MAHYTQEMKKAVAPAIKALCKKYGVKGSLSVDNHMSVVLTVASGEIDFLGNYNETAKIRASRRDDVYHDRTGEIQVNVLWIDTFHTGKAAEFLNEAYKILNAGNYDNSDSQTDYFDVGFYVNINIGRWNKPYNLTA